MKNIFENFGIIILAAGQGKRLGCTDKPKVLMEIGGRLMVSYILETLEKGGVPKKNIVLVVGFQAEKVKEIVGPGYVYALQTEQLGTAHAARIGEEVLPENIVNFMVLNGDDSAFYKFKSINKLTESHLINGNDLTLLTCVPEDPALLGRVVRDETDKMKAVVEKENVTPEMKNIKEVSTGTFCFKREWFSKMFSKINLIPGLNEYGLPSFIELAVKNNAKYDAVKLDDPEWFGINTPEQLAEADKRKREEKF